VISMLILAESPSYSSLINNVGKDKYQLKFLVSIELRIEQLVNG